MHQSDLERAILQNQNVAPFGILINGRPGVGKTAASSMLVQVLEAHNLQAIHIPFDSERHKFAPNGQYDFSDDNVRRLTYANAAEHYSRRIQDGECLVIDTGARTNDVRELLLRIPGMHFVYLEAPLIEVIKRETLRSLRNENPDLQRARYTYAKGIISLVSRGTIIDFPQPGITVPFEKPLIEPHLKINTHKKPLGEVVLTIVTYLQDRGLINGAVYNPYSAA